MMRLDSESFNGLLDNLGQRFMWRKGYACPCVNPNSGQPKINCTHCKGKGRFWQGSTIGKAGIVGREVIKKQSDFALWDAGDIMLSIPSDSALYDIGMYDRLSCLNRTEPFSVNLVSGINENLRFTPVSIDALFWVDGSDQLVIGDIPAIAGDGSLVFGVVRPPNKATYSLTGRRHPEYYCYNELPLDRPHHDGEPLPRRVVLRRFDLFGK